MDGVSASAAEKGVTPFIYHRTEMNGCAKSARGSTQPGLTTKAGTSGTTTIFSEDLILCSYIIIFLYVNTEAPC